MLVEVVTHKAASNRSYTWEKWERFYGRLRKRFQRVYEDLPSNNQAWRLHWFGDFNWDNGDLRFQQIFLPIRHPNHLNSIDHAYVRSVETGVELLPHFAIGRCWQNQESVKSSFATQLLKGLQFPDDTAIKPVWPDSKTGLIPFAAYRFHKHFDARMAVIDGGGSAYEQILIPCHEILRFYYASSSVLIKRLLDHKTTLGNPDLVFDPSRTQLIDGHAFVTPASGIPPSDAHVVARLALSKKAWARACRIQSSLTKNRQNLGRAFPECLPPFDEPTDLTVEGVEITGPIRRFLVLRIRHCTGPFPYESLTCPKDFTIPVDEEPVMPIRKWDRFVRGFRRRIKLTSKTKPQQNGLYTQNQEAEDRFTDIKTKPVIWAAKSIHEWNPTVHLPGGRTVTTKGATGAGEPEDGPNRIKTTTDLDTPETVIPNAPKPKRPLTRPARFETTLAALELLKAETQCSVTQIDLETEEGLSVFPLPEKPTPHYPWCFVQVQAGEEERRRQLLLLQITSTNGETFYCIEAEQPSNEESHRIGLIYNQKYQSLDTWELREIVDRFAANFGVWHREQLPPGFEIRRFNHDKTNPDSDDSRARLKDRIREFIKRTLSSSRPLHSVES